jgi:serine/threonine protein kinase
MFNTQRCRDLKLDNTLLEACIVGLPRIKICDFGFAKRWGAAGDQMHTAIGTPVYMSPQVRSDIAYVRLQLLLLPGSLATTYIQTLHTA